MRMQTERAVAEADRLVFIVDARAGLTPQDEIIARELRRSGKPIILAVNKIESLDAQVALSDFHALGLGEPQPIAATHGQGIRELHVRGARRIRRRRFARTRSRMPSASRSSAAPMSASPHSSIGCWARSGSSPARSPVRRATASWCPFRRDDRDFVLIDTAGIRRRSKVEDLVEKVSVAKTLQAIDHAHVVVMVLDAHDSVGEQDASVLGMALQRGRALLIAINKWDGIPMEQREEIRRQLALKLDFVPYAPLHFISARHGTGVGELVAVGGPRLRGRDARDAHPGAQQDAGGRDAGASAAAGARPAHQTALRASGGPQSAARHRAWQPERARYRMPMRATWRNVFRKTFDLYATPVVVEFRTDSNPYSERRTEHKVGHRPRRKGTASTGHRGAALAKIAGMKAARKKKAQGPAAKSSRPTRSGSRAAPKTTASGRGTKRAAPTRGPRRK